MSKETFAPIASGVALRHMKAIALPYPLARRWSLGQKLACNQAPLLDFTTDENLSDACFRILMSQTQAFLGVGELRTGETPEETLLVPKRVCAMAEPLPESTADEFTGN